MILKKFSLMNPDEEDRIEHLQQTLFRPHSWQEAKNTAQNLLQKMAKKKTDHTADERAMLIRLKNLLKSNSVFGDFTVEQYLKDILGPDTPSRRIAVARLMKDTNKGISGIDDLITFPFADGSKPTERLAKLRLVEDHGLNPTKFELLVDVGDNRLMLDEKGRRLARAGELDTKASVRSVDAQSILNNAVIIWCMKYKGGTAAVGGSGQKDQGTTEGAHIAALIETWYAQGQPLTYLNKPVFFANLVYGAQFNDHKRIVENEMTFKRDRDCYRCFNISLDRVKNVIDYFDKKSLKETTALSDIYDKYAYDINFTGNPKPADRQRLMEWITN